MQKLRSPRQLIALVLAMSAALVLTGCAAPSTATPIVPTVSGAWIMAEPDPAKDMNMTAIFGIFRNASDHTIYILGGKADDATLTTTAFQAHEMVMGADGKMTMRKVAGGIPIPAHGSVTLKPGSYHVMVFDLKKPIVAGDIVTATIRFSNGTSLHIKATARDISNYAG